MSGPGARIPGTVPLAPGGAAAFRIAARHRTPAQAATVSCARGYLAIARCHDRHPGHARRRLHQRCARAAGRPGRRPVRGAFPGPGQTPAGQTPAGQTPAGQATAGHHPARPRYPGLRRRRSLHRPHRATAEQPRHRVRPDHVGPEVRQLRRGEPRDRGDQPGETAAEDLPLPHHPSGVHGPPRRRDRPGHHGQQPRPGLRPDRAGGYARRGEDGRVPVRGHRGRRRRRVGALRDHDPRREDRRHRGVTGRGARILLGGDPVPAGRGQRDQPAPDPGRRAGRPEAGPGRHRVHALGHRGPGVPRP